MDEAVAFLSLRKGLMAFAVLQVISRHKIYAAELLQRLADTDFSTTEGTLYPLLSRLKREGLLQYDWVESESGPPRKYYSLTSKGADALHEMKTYWKHINTTLAQLGGSHEKS